MNLALLLNSLAVGVGATVLALAAGVMVALATSVAGLRSRKVWRCLALINFALPPFLVANGWLEVTTLWRTLSAPETVALLSLPLTALVLATLLWPLTCLLVLGGWGKLQTEHLEADPQVRGWRLCRDLLLPAARGELTVAAAVTLVLALANFTVPTLFQVRVFTEEFWIRFSTQFDTAGALRATWPLVVIPLVVILFLRRRVVIWPRRQLAVPPDFLRRQLGWVATGAQIAAASWLALTLGFPLGRLLLTARTWSELPGAVAAGTAAISNSTWAALLPATLVVVAGLAMGAGGRKVRAPRWTWLLFLVPGVFSGVGFIFVFNRPALAGVYQSLGIVFLALGLRYLAPGWALAAESLRTADASLADAARSLGASRWRVVKDAILPQAMPGLAAAWYAVYLLCLWDVETVVLIQPPGGETLALRIFNLLHYGHAAQVNALCVVMLGLAVAPWLGWTVLRKLATGRTNDA